MRRTAPPPPAAPYDHTKEPIPLTVYDHEREAAPERRSGAGEEHRPAEGAPADLPAPTNAETAGLDISLSASQRPYLPVFLQQLIHVDEPVDRSADDDSNEPART